MKITTLDEGAIYQIRPTWIENWPWDWLEVMHD